MKDKISFVTVTEVERNLSGRIDLLRYGIQRSVTAEKKALPFYKRLRTFLL
jgi:hypothetical protein